MSTDAFRNVWEWLIQERQNNFNKKYGAWDNILCLVICRRNMFFTYIHTYIHTYKVKIPVYVKTEMNCRMQRQVVFTVENVKKTVVNLQLITAK